MHTTLPEGLHGAVGHDVELELVQPVELLVAAHVFPEGALEPLHRAVTLQMTLELVLPIEPFVAFLTRERKLAGVNELVSF